MRLVLVFTALSAVIGSIGLLWSGSWEERFTLEGTIGWIEGTGDWAWIAGVGLLVVDLVMPVPNTVVQTALGYLYGPYLGGLLGGLGSMLAGMLGYGAGRLCGERFARRWLGDKDVDRGERLFSRGGIWMVALTRSLPVLPEVISCMAGLVRMPFWQYLLALACGCFPVAFLFAALGAAGHEAPGWVIAFSVIVPALLSLVAWRLGRK